MDFTQWEMAEKACKALLHGSAPESQKHTWLLMLLMPTLAREQQFFFTQIEIPLVHHSQSEVHGLLGQRVVQPAFTRTINPAARTAAASQDALFDDRPPTGSFGAQDSPRRGVVNDPTTRPGVGQATASSMAELFGSQGEGAIVGHYSEYMVESISEHDRFKYSRFVCKA